MRFLRRRAEEHRQAEQLREAQLRYYERADKFFANMESMFEEFASRVPESYSPKTVERIPAVAAAVRLLAGEVSRLPIIVQQEGDDDWKPVDERDPEQFVLGQQWTATKGKSEAMFFAMRSLLLHGFTANLLRRTPDGRVEEIVPLNPEVVTRDASGTEIRYLYNGLPREDIPSVLPREDLVWLEWAPAFDGHRKPVAPAQQCWDAMKTLLYATVWAGVYFKRGAVAQVMYQLDPGAVVLPDEIWKREDEMRASGRSTLQLPTGAKPIKVGGNPENAQLIDLMVFGVQEVARVFGLPPMAVQELSHGTYTNFPQSLRFLARITVSLLAEQWADALTTMIYPQDEPRLNGRNGARRRIVLDLGDIGDESLAQKWDRLDRSVIAGTLLKKEARERKGLPELSPAEAEGLADTPGSMPGSPSTESGSPGASQSDGGRG